VETVTLPLVPAAPLLGGQVDVYEFIITDLYGDGICCGQGRGSYALILDNVTVVSSGGIFGSKEVTYFTVGSANTIGKDRNGDDDEKQWLAKVEMEDRQKGVSVSRSLYPYNIFSHSYISSLRLPSLPSNTSE
jgi:hypothetical protein